MTNTETNANEVIGLDITADDYWIRQERADNAWLAAHAGHIVEVTSRSEGYDGDYYRMYTVTVLTSEGKLESRRFGEKRGAGIKVDASQAVVDAANDCLEDAEYARLVTEDLADASKPAKGKLVVVKRGRTAPIGFEGEIFWLREETYSPRFNNGYKKGPDAIKVGIAPVGAKFVNGKREGAVFTYLKNCDVLNADMYITDTLVLQTQAKVVRRFKIAK